MPRKQKENDMEEGKVEKLTKMMERQRLILVEDLLKVKGNGTILEKKLANERRLADEMGGRLVQINEILKFLKLPENGDKPKG